MMAATITVTGSTLEPGTPVRLFSTRIVGGGGTPHGSAVRRRPRRALSDNTVLDDDAAPITLLMNWRPPS